MSEWEEKAPVCNKIKLWSRLLSAESGRSDSAYVYQYKAEYIFLYNGMIEWEGEK